jgi:uncharacterized protein YicC (UPF0701 family)
MFISTFSNHQIVLNAHTLEQTMKNKIEAFLNRGEIRDCFDIEFLLRRGVELPEGVAGQSGALFRKLSRLKDNDFKVKLGSILESDVQNYYIQNRFSYLEEKLISATPKP